MTAVVVRPAPPESAAPIDWRADRRLWDLNPADYDLVTIDVFDTLLLRSCYRPEAIFERVAAAAEDDLSPTIGAEGFVLLRREAEARARRRSRASGRNGEVTLDDIYAELPISVGDARRLMERETAMEAAAVIANPMITALLYYLRAARLPVWLVSDMYLGEHQIRTLLQAAGIGPELYDRLIVSSDRHASKREGSLFRILLGEAGLSAGKILHIGDDAVADHQVPASLGIAARHYPPAAVTREILRREALLGAPQTNLASNARGLAEAAMPADECAPFWYRYGAVVIGPIAEAYAAWVVERTVALGIRRIAPFMREGRLLAHLMKRYAVECGYDLAIEPLRVSREALRLPALVDLSEADLDGFGTQNVVRTLRSLLRLLGVNDPPGWMAGLADRRLIDLVAEREGDVWPRVKAYILNPSVREPIRARARAARTLAEDYLIDRFAAADRVATVDLGARGTTQALLQTLPSLAATTDLHHFLFYGLRTIVEHRLAGCRFETFLPETTSGYELADLLYRTPFFIELLISGNDDTTAGYSRTPGGAVRPVLKPGIGNAAQVSAIDACRRGIEGYAAMAQRIRPTGDRRLATRDEIVAIAHRAVQMPTQEEAQELGGLIYDFNDGTDFARILCDDAALDTIRSLERFRPELRLKFALQQRASLLPWPQGAMTLRDPDAIERLHDACSPNFGIAAVCRHLLDQIREASHSSVVLYAAGGAGGMGPTFIRMAAERGIDVTGYLDHLPGTVSVRFEGIEVIQLTDLPVRSHPAIAVCSTGYGKQIIAEIARVYAPGGETPPIFSLEQG